MKILLAHNRYLHPGGEDAVFEAEAALLRRFGHRVVEYTEDNRRIASMGRGVAGVRTLWSSGSRRRLLGILRREKPDVVHFHNTFPLISPSAYYACRECGIPVIQTLHNYRLLCAGSLLFRAGGVCEECLDKAALWPGVLHGCYRGSRLETAGVSAMLGLHRLLGTWRREVDVYVALCEFAQKKFVDGGLPEDRIVVKPNFVHPDPGTGDGKGSYVLFAGRLSPEKGIELLLQVWSRLDRLPLVIAGDGPLRPQVQKWAESRPDGEVRLLGHRSRQEVAALMRGARFLVFPSCWYEGFPMAIVEAFACGLPVVCSNLGAAAEIVENRRTGIHFVAGEPASLAESVTWLWSHSSEGRRMGREARREFETRYTAERNYPLLVGIYARARARR